MVEKKQHCTVCGVWIGDERVGNSRHVKCAACYYEYHRILTEEHRRRNGILPARENPDCPVYLGDIGEELVCATFEGAERMPYGFSGYDFICAGG